MIHSLLTAGVRLAEALAAENEALASLDLPRAAELAPVKITAADAFAAAHEAARKTGARAEGQLRHAAEGLQKRLDELSSENRRLLERAIALQSRVIETIAGAAVPAAVPVTYGAAGHRRPPGAAPALTLSARA